MRTTSDFEVKVNAGIVDDTSNRFIIPQTQHSFTVRPEDREYSSVEALQLRIEAMAREAYSKHIWGLIESNRETEELLSEKEWTQNVRIMKITEIKKPALQGNTQCRDTAIATIKALVAKQHHTVVS